MIANRANARRGIKLDWKMLPTKAATLVIEVAKMADEAFLRL